MSLTRVGLAHPDQRLRPEARFLCLWGTIVKKLTQSSLPYKGTCGDEQLKEARSTFRYVNVQSTKGAYVLAVEG